MNRIRIDKIKDVADKIVKLGNKKLINDFLSEEYRNKELSEYFVKVARKLTESDMECFSMDDICDILNISNVDDIVGNDYWLVRDLLAIRILEISSPKM
ncbi:MAG: hypothetical protein U0457_08380 [Candidatus Sericytochromatia bacterium]